MTSPRMWMEGADDTAIAAWVAERLQPAPLLWRGVARYLGAGDDLWASAVVGEPLDLSPWSYACFTETLDEAADWAAYAGAESEVGAELTVVLLLDGDGVRMTDRDGNSFAEWLVPNTAAGPTVITKTSAGIRMLRCPAFMQGAPVDGVRVIVCRP